MNRARQDLITAMAVMVSTSLAEERRFAYLDEDGSIVLDLPLLADALIEQGYSKEKEGRRK